MYLKTLSLFIVIQNNLQPRIYEGLHMIENLNLDLSFSLQQSFFEPLLFVCHKICPFLFFKNHITLWIIRYSHIKLFIT